MREGRRQENLRVRACEARSPSSTSAPPPTGLSFLVCKMGITVVFESESCSVVSDSLWLHGLQPARIFSRPEYWSGQPFSFPGDLPKPGIEPRSPALQADSLPAEPQGKPSQFKLRNMLSGESGIRHYIKNLTLGYYLAAKVLLFTVQEMQRNQAFKMDVPTLFFSNIYQATSGLSCCRHDLLCVMGNLSFPARISSCDLRANMHTFLNA